MKFIRTREHERTAKKKHTQPTIPVEIRKKLLAASKKQSEQEPEDENEYDVDQVEATVTELTEQTVHTASTITQAVQPIIRTKIVQASIKERPVNAEMIHHAKDIPDPEHSTEAVPSEVRQQLTEQKTNLDTKGPTPPIEPNHSHYGQAKASLSEQPSSKSLHSPKEKPSGGSTVPKTKPTVTQKAAQQHTATPITKAKPSKAFIQKAANTTTTTIKETGNAVARAGHSLLQSLAGLAGGGILLIALSVILLLAAVFSSPMGILFSDQSEQPDTVLLNVAIAQINAEYAAKLEELQEGEYDSIEIHGTPPDWREVVAVFASKTAGGDQSVDVMTLDVDRVDRLRAVFWDMTEIQAEEEDGVLHITINAKTAEDMRSVYLFSRYQNQALDMLLEELDSISSVMGDLSISQEDAIALLQNLPDDLDATRKAVIEHALSLVGKVNYFWGGKSLVLGWDSRWGTTMQVTAEGSSTTGTYRPFGLDCSGFVDWAIYNATDGTYLVGDGGGTIMQHDNCREISWSRAQPGDLVFCADDSHVGIVGGQDEHGNWLVIHCAASPNNVVITGADSFTVVAKPPCFSR